MEKLTERQELLRRVDTRVDEIFQRRIEDPARYAEIEKIKKMTVKDKLCWLFAEDDPRHITTEL